MRIEDKIRLGQQRIMSTQLLPRDMPDPALLKLPKIISFLGGRRVGKSSMMIALLQQYLEHNHITLDQIIFLDFSEIDNHRIDLSEVYLQYKDTQPFFVLDEIQELPDFEKQLTFLHNQGCRLFISGSNAQLLSQEISTKLRGRVIEIYVDILSFEEYLVFNNISANKGEVILDNHFDDYLMRGGYPEIVLSKDIIAKKSILRSYLEILIYKDIIDRYKVRNQEILEKLLKSIILGHTKPLNINRLKNTYSSLGYHVSKNTLYEYVQYIKNTFFANSLSKYYKKSYSDKIYIIDNGYMNLFSEQENFGQKFENTIYKHLKKKDGNLGYVSDGYEIDFTNGKTNRQVCYEIHEKNYTREFIFGEKQQDKENIIITKHSSGFIFPSVKNISYKDLLL